VNIGTTSVRGAVKKFVGTRFFKRFFDLVPKKRENLKIKGAPMFQIPPFHFRC